MTPVSEATDALDQALHQSVAFWWQLGEEEHVYAEVLAQALGPDDWRELDAIWRLRPVEWQRCLATVLTLVAPPEAVPWLLEMIERGDEVLALHAIDELRAMQRERSLVLPWPPLALQRVRELWRRHRGFTSRTVEEFIADMARGQW
jgi:hypothetical protein